jgi:hypothetical protein
MIYDGNNNYRGDLVRWSGNWRSSFPGHDPGESWSWQPYSEGSYVVDGTINQCSEAIFKLAEEDPDGR